MISLKHCALVECLFLGSVFITRVSLFNSPVVISIKCSFSNRSKNDLIVRHGKLKGSLFPALYVMVTLQSLV